MGNQLTEGCSPLTLANCLFCAMGGVLASGAPEEEVAVAVDSVGPAGLLLPPVPTVLQQSHNTLLYQTFLPSCSKRPRIVKTKPPFWGMLYLFWV